MTEAFVEFLRRWGEMGPGAVAVLAAVFLVTGLIPIPRTFFCLGSGVVFGLSSIPVILPATTLSAMLGFLLARYLFADRLRRMIAHKPKVLSIMNAVDAEGWRIVALCRFASPLPSMVQTYAFGLTRIGLWPYTIATFLFTLPQVVLYVYLGAIGKAALLEQSHSPAAIALMLAGAATFLAVIVLIARRVRARVFPGEASPRT